MSRMTIRNWLETGIDPNLLKNRPELRFFLTFYEGGNGQWGMKEDIYIKDIRGDEIHWGHPSIDFTGDTDSIDDIWMELDLMDLLSD